LAHLETAARALARSGVHLDFSTIKGVLGPIYPDEAEKFFRNSWNQQELNRICELSQRLPRRADTSSE
jgi:hypothetical protein